MVKYLLVTILALSAFCTNAFAYTSESKCGPSNSKIVKTAVVVGTVVTAASVASLYYFTPVKIIGGVYNGAVMTVKAAGIPTGVFLKGNAAGIALLEGVLVVVPASVLIAGKEVACNMKALAELN